MRTALVSVLLLAACGGDDDDPTADWVPNDGPPARINGMAFLFGPNPHGLSVEGATIAVAEDPTVSTTVAADGSFAFDVPSGGPSTFSLTQPEFHPNQSATLEIGADGIARLGFQAPTEETFVTLGLVAQVDPDPAACQISTTISRAGTEPYGGDGLGVEGATATLDPLPEGQRVVYFAYDNGAIYPDPSLTATTLDGGVILPNVPPGEYTLRASAPGSTFAEVHIRCRAGVLVNAAPPNGLQQL